MNLNKCSVRVNLTLPVDITSDQCPCQVMLKPVDSQQLHREQKKCSEEISDLSGNKKSGSVAEATGAKKCDSSPDNKSIKIDKKRQEPKVD